MAVADLADALTGEIIEVGGLRVDDDGLHPHYLTLLPFGQLRLLSLLLACYPERADWPLLCQWYGAERRPTERAIQRLRGVLRTCNVAIVSDYGYGYRLAATEAAARTP